MKQVCEDFMNQRLPLTAVAAWGVRLADQTVLTKCYADWFATEQVEQSIQHLINAARTLNDHQIQPVRLCWVYEHVRIFLAIRPDDVCAGIFAENRQGFSFSEIEGVLDEFLVLPAA